MAGPVLVEGDKAGGDGAGGVFDRALLGASLHTARTLPLTWCDVCQHEKNNQWKMTMVM